MKTLKEKEQKINKLKSQRAKQWQKKKSERDYEEINELHNKINKLKSEVKQAYV